jgi:hypothetical protein
MKLSNGLIAAALLALAVPVSAQSLGELAKREAERKKAAPAAAKTYTNEDLKKLPPAPGENPAAPVDSAKAAEALKALDPSKPDDKTKPTVVKPDGVPAGDGAKDEKYWRDRITAVKEDIRRNETFKTALQSQINALTTDFANRDDPAQRAKIADDRQKALAELARLTLDLDKANKQITDIEEEARRAGVPPGWIR